MESGDGARSAGGIVFVGREENDELSAASRASHGDPAGRASDQHQKGRQERAPARRGQRPAGVAVRRSSEDHLAAHAFNDPEAKRVPVCLEPEETAVAQLQEIERQVVELLSQQSLRDSKIFGGGS